MEKKSSYTCADGRSYHMTMSWNENFKDADKVFKINFLATAIGSGETFKFPREISTYAIGDTEESLGERVKYYYGGNREMLMQDYLTSAYRRACDYIERGH
jgi:hypothetical protein